MHLSRITGIAVAAMIAATPSALAQTQTPAQNKAGATTAVQTFTGCLMTEPDYRQAHNLGKGALNGMGLGDEWVLVDAKVSAAKSASTTDATMKSDASGTSASASSGKCEDKGMAYRLTGTQEEKLKGLGGHELEVQGRFKHADDVTANGTQAGEKLPAEVEIVSFREAPIPAPVSQPAQPAMTTPPSTPPASTVEPLPRNTAAAPTTTTPNELPHSASSTGLVALIGLLALGSGVVLTVFRRRAL